MRNVYLAISLMVLQSNDCESAAFPNKEADFFQCSWGNIPITLRCDGTNNCGDNSDEESCEKDEAEAEIEKLKAAVFKAVRENNFSKAKELQQKIDKILMDKTQASTNQNSLQDCQFAKDAGIPLPGIQTLQVDSDKTVRAFCDTEGWTVFQSRGQFGNDPDFFIKPWQDFKEGFGTPGEEHWAGLDVIHKLTNQPGRAMQLRISLEKFSGDKATDYYDVFSVGSESSNYKLTVSGYHGNGGDSFWLDSSSQTRNGMQFSTFDQDNDQWAGGHCATKSFGHGGAAGWWNDCGYENLNGYNYGNAKISIKCMYWYNWGDKLECLKSITMAIRPV